MNGNGYPQTFDHESRAPVASEGAQEQSTPAYVGKTDSAFRHEGAKVRSQAEALGRGQTQSSEASHANAEKRGCAHASEGSPYAKPEACAGGKAQRTSALEPR